MHFKNLSWKIDKIVKMRGEIDPKPQYQRGPVWKTPKQQLLIDTIINRFDIPKIYLRHMKGGSTFEYEVADGQQRLNAIWDYIDSVYPLGSVQYQNGEWQGKLFSELTASQQKHVLDFDLIVTAVYGASNDEIRELFARLQKGERLTPPELRNSIASALGNVVRAMANTHEFFKSCSIPEARYKRDDFLAHAFIVELYSGSCDLKAPELAAMYGQYKTAVPSRVISKVNSTLAYMCKMERAAPGCIRTKWGFVDIFWIVSKNRRKLPEPELLAKRFVQFEQFRLHNTKHPAALIDSSNKHPDKAMYDYIMAFNVGGSLKENVAVRQKVLRQKLLKG